jgi:hypothetical protein
MFPQAAKVSAKTGMMQKSVISNDLIAVTLLDPHCKKCGATFVAC